MKSRILFFLLTTATFAQGIPAQAPNLSMNGKREGHWVIWFDKDWSVTADSTVAAYYRKIYFKNDRPEGKTADYFKNRKMQWQGHLLSNQPDQFDGIQTWYFENGNLQNTVNYRRGVVHGKSVLYYQNGQKQQTGHFSNGKKDGKFILYYDDGKVNLESFYKDDLESGVWTVYNKDGSVQERQDISVKQKFIELLKLNDSLHVLSTQKHYTDALPLAERILNLAADVRGKKTADYAACLGNLAEVHRNLGNYPTAISLYSEAEILQKEILGPEDSAHLASLNALKLANEALGDQDALQKIYVEIVEIFQKSSNTQQYANALNEACWYYIEREKFEVAKQFCDRAYKVVTSQNFTQEEKSTVLANKANVAEGLGNISEAEQLYIESLEILNQSNGTDSMHYGMILNDFALLYINLGIYDGAETRLMKTIEIRKKHMGANSKEYAVGLNNLGEFYNRSDQYDKAVEQMEESAKILKTIDVESYAMVQNNLANLYHRTKKDTLAVKLFEEVLDIRKKRNGKTSPDYLRALNNLGTQYLFQFRYEEAEKIMAELDELLKSVEIPPQIRKIMLSNLGILYDEINKPNLAAPLFIEFNDLLRQEILNNSTFLEDQELAAYIKARESDLEILLTRCLKYQNTALSNSTLNSLLAIKGLRLRNQSRIKKQILNSSDKDLKEKYSKYLVLKKELLSLSMSKPEIDVNFQRLRQEVAALEKVLIKKSFLIKNEIDMSALTWQTISKHLRKDEVVVNIIDYIELGLKSEFPIKYAAFIIESNQAPQLVYLCEQRQLDSLAIALPGNQIYDHKNRNTNSINLGLYNLIIRPLQPFFSGKKNVYLSASGSLENLSFNSIPIPGERYVVDEPYQLRRYFDFNELINRQNTFTPKISKVVLYGGIDYDSLNNDANADEKERTIIVKKTADIATNQSGFHYLEGSKFEVDTIQSIFKTRGLDVSLYTGKDADEQNFKATEKMIPHPDIIHIATHGFTYYFDSILKDKNIKHSEGAYAFASSKNPFLRTGLLMAGANRTWSTRLALSTNMDDGILTAAEISNLDLTGCKLAVLSACDTGLGLNNHLEGIIGLQRGLKISGVEKVIVSLWEVDDEFASDFMTSFYTALLETNDVQSSFLTTQRKFKEKYRDPYYWGSFVLKE